MATAINFAATPRASGVTISTANTNRDGTGTVGTVITAGTNGTRVDRIRVQAKVTTTAGMIRLFLFNGSAYFLIQEVTVAAATVGASVQAAATDVLFGDTRPLSLPAGWTIVAATHNAEAHDVTAYGADY